MTDAEWDALADESGYVPNTRTIMDTSWLDSILNTGLGVYTAATAADTARRNANSTAQRTVAAGNTNNQLMTYGIIGGGIILLLIVVLFVFKK